MTKPSWETDFAKILIDEYASLRRTNPRFSLRGFAKRLGMSSGTLSDIINRKKKWNLRPNRAAKLLNELSVKPAVRNRLLVEMGMDPIHTEENLTLNDHSILTDWTYQPILCAFLLPTSYSAVPLMAARLGVSEEKVKSVIADALKRGLLIKNAEGKLEKPDVYLKTSDGIPSGAIVKHHIDNLELAQRALTTQSRERRDFTSLTFVADKKRIESLRTEVRKLYKKASSLVASESDEYEIFRLSVQLFPMDFSEK